jgi:hypothetical protein
MQAILHLFHLLLLLLLPNTTKPAGKSLPSAGAKSSFSYCKLASAVIVNNGHTLQVALPADFKSDVSIPIRGELLLSALSRSCLTWCILSWLFFAVEPCNLLPPELLGYSHSQHVTCTFWAT